MNGGIRYIEEGQISELAEERQIRVNVVRKASEASLSGIDIGKGDHRGDEELVRSTNNGNLSTK